VVKSSLVRQVLVVAALALVPGLGQAIYFRDKSFLAIISSSLGNGDSGASAGMGRDWQFGSMPPEMMNLRGPCSRALSLNEDRWNESLAAVSRSVVPEKKVVIYCSSQSCKTPVAKSRAACVMRRS